MISDLSDHYFEKIGSLINDKTGHSSIVRYLSPSFTWQERDSLELGRGLFNEKFGYIKSLVSPSHLMSEIFRLHPRPSLYQSIRRRSLSDMYRIKVNG